MLPLPAFLLGAVEGLPSAEDALQALTLTGYFLDRHIWVVAGKGQPDARERLTASLARDSRRATES